MDTTVKSFSLNRSKLDDILQYIIEPNKNNDIIFIIKNIREIRPDFEYDGYNIMFEYQIDNMKFPVRMDITTGEHTLPAIENKEINLMFEKGTISFSTYSVEQILADKIYTTLAYGNVDDKNTRMKDLYDIYFLTTTQKVINYADIRKGIQFTKEQRNQTFQNIDKILSRLENSTFQKENWDKYSAITPFAKNISFNDVMSQLKKTCRKLFS